MKARFLARSLTVLTALFCLFLYFRYYPRSHRPLFSEEGETPPASHTRPRLSHNFDDVPGDVTRVEASTTTLFYGAPASTPTLSLPTGDPNHLEEAHRYVKAIMTPDDDSFPRLLCPISEGKRYEYLQSASNTSTDHPIRPKYFFALDLHECAALLPSLIGSIIETIRFLGPENCALSLVEGRSKDGSFEIMKVLQEEVEKLPTSYILQSSSINPISNGTDRIEALAQLRNLALQPLADNPTNYDPDTTIIFINDVAICMEDILELLHQRLYQNASMTCAMDWIYGGAFFYDVWIARSMTGQQFFEIPQSGTYDFSGNLFWDDPATRSRLDAKLPFQVFACWNGATAFTAKPFLEHQIKFRTNQPGECYMGEPNHLCKDLWHHGYGRIAVVPSVNVGYNDEESEKVKAKHGTTSSWTEQEESENTKIVWDITPPRLVKCVTEYQHPSWVPWDQGLEII